MRERLDALVDEMFDRGLLYDEARREFERRFIIRALARCPGSLTGVADRLGIHRNTLSRKIAGDRLARRR